MNKLRAIKILGGTQVSAAEKLGISRQAVHKWPDPIPASVVAKIKRYKAGEQFKRQHKAHAPMKANHDQT